MASFGLATVSELVDKRKNRFLLQFNVQPDHLLCGALYASNLLLVHY